MYTRVIRYLGVVSCVALVACAQDDQPAEQAEGAQTGAEMASPSDRAPITQQEVAAFSDHSDAAIRDGDTAVFRNFYTDDAVMVSARGKVEGAPALITFWKDAVAAGKGKSLQTELLKFGTDGDLAWALNRFTGGVTAPAGHTLRVFQRQPDGSLRTVVQLSIPDMPAQQ